MANRKTLPQKSSQGVKWSRTRSTGVRYWESDTRKHRGRPDKCYVIRYKRHGQTVSETVGWQSDGITPEFCSQLRGQITSNIKTGQGHQSLQEKRDLETARKRAHKSESITLSQAFHDFLNTRTLKDRTIKDYRRTMEVAFTDWQQRRVLDITRDMVSKRHGKLGKEQGSAQANQHLRVLRALLNFVAGFFEDAQGGPLLKFNPVERLSQTKAWYRVPRKQTIIKGHELPAWFEAVINLENETVRDYLLFLLFTGSRKEEGLTLEMDQVDLKSKAYTVLDPKNRQPLTLPMGTYLFEMLEKRMKLLTGQKYVFPGSGPKGHLVEPKRPVARVIKESSVKFTLHDLRRHFITLAESLDLSTFSVKRLVNHSMGSDVTGGYIVSDVERLREPMQKIEDRILRLAGVAKPGKVIKLRATS